MKELIPRCIRILHIARKPTNRELDEIMKIAGAGMLLVGVVGIIMFMVFSVI
ncbi:MAG: protein translocase SEC61 complex subunit gamma [Candidatus ainarchaeum sp.]|nr:protein translocase SEC61 complex subunit gamma [Candidatus ainarchaeum sp.]MDD5096682.1 protein translocase SEC61 complex subunit gamma [Candidatus ainarchaeum sp.]